MHTSIPPSEYEINFVGARGPGGQNVNKTATKAQLRWNVLLSRTYTHEEKTRILLALHTRINDRGEIVLSSDAERSQLQNKNRVVARLHTLIEHALVRKTPRKATRPTRSSKHRRLDTKKKHGQKKMIRRQPNLE